MITPPRVSIVVPVHDGAAWLSEAIESVRGQTRDDWEVIVVDDGSRDGSAQVVDRDLDPRVSVLRQDHAGVLAARRSGAAAARGEYVVFLDADDRLRPDALARLAAVLARRPDVSLAYGDRVLVDRSGRVYGSRHGALLSPRPSGDVLAQLLS